MVQFGRRVHRDGTRSVFMPDGVARLMSAAQACGVERYNYGYVRGRGWRALWWFWCDTSIERLDNVWRIAAVEYPTQAAPHSDVEWLKKAGISPE